MATNIVVEGAEIAVTNINSPQEGYISLTDIAKVKDDVNPSFII